MKEFADRDFSEYEVKCKTSPKPFYPFGNSDGLDGKTCVKKCPISGAIYRDLKPIFEITLCSHVFSGA